MSFLLQVVLMSLRRLLGGMSSDLFSLVGLLYEAFLLIEATIRPTSKYLACLYFYTIIYNLLF